MSCNSQADPIQPQQRPQWQVILDKPILYKPIHVPVGEILRR